MTSKDKNMESVKPIVELTADGSHTLFVPQLNEHYHSVNGAIQEANHVFLDAGLSRCKKDEVAIFEVGFGTGLNAFLTAKYADQYNTSIRICYTSIEAFPLSLDLIDTLNYAEENDKALYRKLHEVEWESEQQISDQFFLTKIEADFTKFDFSTLKDQFDIIYFDAFAPDVQDYMWSQEMFDAMYQICREGAVLTTYCAKGIVRRRMQAAGFTVERIPGPPGKREMLRATKKI